jgi:hypothetical protein
MTSNQDDFLDDYSAKDQEMLLDDDIQAESEALMDEDLLSVNNLGGTTSNERLLQNLAQASKEVVVLKTLKSYEQYAEVSGFCCTLPCLQLSDGFLWQNLGKINGILCQEGAHK